ncbi:hypothetical protein ACHAPT_001350 [Fusarium lateritium]
MPSNFPKSVVVIGAGAFGLSTALAISSRYPDTTITVIDRLTPPSLFPASQAFDANYSANYLDDRYETLADKAQDILRNDPAVAPHYFEQGFTFISDGIAGEFDDLTTNMLNNIKSKHPESAYVELNTPEEVYQSLHGKEAELVPEFNAEAIIKIYYDRCRARKNVKFLLGTPVDALIYGERKEEVLGVALEDGRRILAEKTICCTGAWSSRLVKLDGIFSANAVGLVYIKLTPEENEKYEHISCHTNLVTGLNIFQPINGWLKILRRGAGLQNTTVLKDPENPDKTYKASYPRTAVDDPSQWVPLSFEKSVREELREIFPAMADRRFDLARFCWLEQTTTGDFLICPHPKFKNLQMAIGGSFHGWKFLPLLGEFVTDSINGDLEPGLAHRWSWEQKLDADMKKLGFLAEGQKVEFQQYVGGVTKL